jgi:TonB-dependent starch-binding outer membrane protein SusC
MKKSLLLFVTATFYAALALAQDRVTGIVKDEDGSPVPGATVVVKGSTVYTLSDVDGKFAIDAPRELPFTLQVNFVGFKPQEVEIYELSGEPADIFLKIDNVLNEVVVIGYDTRQRKDVIGSITKIDPIDVKNIPTGSFDAQLQGKISGVQISSNTGVPGEAVNVRVRGATSINADVDPLYVIDGVFINNNSLQTIGTGGKATSPIADINPSDIESIEVLKDASATALYGSRGANGVILITTKRGNYEQKPTINFSTSQGWAKAPELWDLATGPQHAELVNEWWINTGIDKPSLNQTFANRPFRPVGEVINGQPGRGLPEEQQTYDRLSEVFRTARLQNYDLSLSGGTQSTRYYLGGGYNTQESILSPITFERAGLKLNLDQKVNDKVQVGISNTFSRTYRNQARAGDGPAGGLLQAALHTPTYLSPYNEQGQLVGRAGFDNVTLLLQNYDVHARSLRYISNLYAEGEIIPGLKLRTSWGADYNNYDESEYWNTFLISGSPNGLATSNITQNTTLLNEQTLIYRKKVSDHSFGILLGNTLQSEVTERTGAEGRGFANNSIKLISSASTQSSSQSWTKATLASFFSRIDYNYADKYLIDVSFRADGSSRFGANKRWGYFPSVGAAWRLKQESFLKDVQFVSDLKLRASYGITGNQNFNNSAAQTSTSANFTNFAGQGLWTANTPYQINPGIAPSQLANPNLKWEETQQLNVGINASFLEKRVSLEFNVYNKYTKDGLLQVPIGATSGFPNYWGNGIEVSNKGFELDLQTVNIERKDLLWTTSINLARNVNNIEKLPNPVSFGSRNLILQQEGSPMYSFWVYKQLYVDPQTGNVVYEDVTGDGSITADDRQIYSSIWPKLFGGMTNTVTYKGIDLSLFFAFQYGNKVYNHNKFFGEGGGARDAARIIFASNVARWQKPGDITDVPRPDGINNNNYKDGGSHWLEDGSFLRLRSLTVGYTLPTQVSQRLRVERLRVFFQGTNLWLLTNYSGLDPESASSSSQNEQGIDLGTPPQPRGLQVGLDIRL